MSLKTIEEIMREVDDVRLAANSVIATLQLAVEESGARPVLTEGEVLSCLQRMDRASDAVKEAISLLFKERTKG